METSSSEQNLSLSKPDDQSALNTPPSTETPPRLKSFPFKILLSILFLALLSLGGLILAKSLHAPTTDQPITTPTPPVSLIPESSTSETANWKTYNSSSEDFFYDLKGTFNLKYPPDLTQSYADGPGTSAAVFFNQNFGLSISRISDKTSSPRQLAEKYIHDILSREPGVPNCDLIPNCTSSFFSVSEQNLGNNLVASVVSGPSIPPLQLSQIYFIRVNNEQLLRLDFNFQDTEESLQLVETIFSTFKFIEPEVGNSSLVTGSISAYHLNAGDKAFATVKLAAQSTASQVTEMQIWTDVRNDNKWEAFQELVTVFPILGDPQYEIIYVRFKDDQGNLSQTYSTTLRPPQGPPPEQ